MQLTGVVLVTGTGTGIGKTMVTAALAGAGLAAGQRVAVVKPVQTGVRPGEPGDIAEVQRLLGRLGPDHRSRLSMHEFLRLPDALAPQAAGRRSGCRLPALSEHATRIADLSRDADLVLVEGAGGVLVRLDGTDAKGGTIADLHHLLAADGSRGVVLVTTPELGTLNATELAVEALRHRDVPVLGLVIGCWPADPGPAEQDNLRDLPALTGIALLGVIRQAPRGVPRLTRPEVTAAKPGITFPGAAIMRG